jgi:mannose-6-phosphate isomerase-like protein (cupin superfamily)
MTVHHNHLPSHPDTIAPDGSEIRYLVTGQNGQMVHCTMPAGTASRAIRHRTIEEYWYVIEGEGDIWIEHSGDDDIIELKPGVSFVLPKQTRMQFRARNKSPLTIILVTIPPWPGDDEVEFVEGIWPPTVN